MVGYVCSVVSGKRTHVEGSFESCERNTKPVRGTVHSKQLYISTFVTKKKKPAIFHVCYKIPVKF